MGAGELDPTEEPPDPADDPRPSTEEVLGLAVADILSASPACHIRIKDEGPHDLYLLFEVRSNRKTSRGQTVNWPQNTRGQRRRGLAVVLFSVLDNNNTIIQPLTRPLMNLILKSCQAKKRKAG